MQKQSSESSQSAGNFNRGQSTLKQSTVQTKKEKSKRKIETMVSNMNIKIIRYQASIDQWRLYSIIRFLVKRQICKLIRQNTKIVEISDLQN